jgi:hypothetical protein
MQTEIKNKKDVSLTVLFWSEGKDYFFYCPALDIQGHGNSAQQAKIAFEGMLNGFLQHTRNSQTILDELEKLGWMINREKKRVHAPEYSEMLEDNATLRELQAKRNIRKVMQEVSLVL